MACVGRSSVGLHQPIEYTLTALKSATELITRYYSNEKLAQCCFSCSSVQVLVQVHKCLRKYLLKCVSAHSRKFSRTFALLHTCASNLSHSCTSTFSLAHLSKYLRTCALAHVFAHLRTCALALLRTCRRAHFTCVLAHFTCASTCVLAQILAHLRICTTICAVAHWAFVLLNRQIFFVKWKQIQCAQ